MNNIKSGSQWIVQWIDYGWVYVENDLMKKFVLSREWKIEEKDNDQVAEDKEYV